MKYYYSLLILIFVTPKCVCLGQTTNIKSTSLAFSHHSGFYQNDFFLNLFTNDSNVAIHYTTNGAIPKHTDPVFTNPILITNQSEKANILSSISTSERWEQPKDLIYKGTVIRAKAFQDTIAVSPVYAKTYFITDGIKKKYSFPIVSIITDSLNLFQEDSGIYIVGNNTNYSQRGKTWERNAYFEYFDANGIPQLKQNIGIRIHGNKGRTFPQKSLRLYARSEYGEATFKYPFFADKPTTEFKRLLLRSASSNDWKNTLFKNELAQQLTVKLNLSHQSSIPVIVFINGEYWGIHHLSERIDKYYLNEYYSVSKDSLDFLSNNAIVEEGSNTDYLYLIEYIKTHDLADNTNYASVAEKIDISNFIDYNISQIFLANTDWPNNNIKLWKGQLNGKWRWIMTDCDECMSYEQYAVLGDFVHSMPYHQYFPEWATILLHNLLKNEVFKHQFRSRFETLLLNNFSTTNILNEISLLKNTYENEVMEHVYRWGAPATFSDWKEAVAGLNAFAALRLIEMKGQLNNLFKDPIIIVPNPATKFVTVQSLINSNNKIIITFYNSTGQNVYSEEFKNSSDLNDSILDISHLRKGIYLIKSEINQYLYTKKILVE